MTDNRTHFQQVTSQLASVLLLLCMRIVGESDDEIGAGPNTVATIRDAAGRPRNASGSGNAVPSVINGSSSTPLLVVVVVVGGDSMPSVLSISTVAVYSSACVRPSSRVVETALHASIAANTPPTAGIEGDGGS